VHRGSEEHGTADDELIELFGSHGWRLTNTRSHDERCVFFDIPPACVQMFVYFACP
jgi:hypothetical protein